MAAPISKKFINGDGSHVVEEMLAGMVALHPRHLAKLEGLNTIVRKDFAEIKQTQVVLVSGGGSGHEPAHAGFCGDGMLTAAVCGQVFASPSVDSILYTIRTVCGPKGCLLIVKNYTGDRLNFGLAAEQAKAEGYLVELVVVADDAALVEKGVTGRRGLAGTVLVHKVAGAAAAAGQSLAEVVAAAEQVASSVRTVGAALSVCNVPGKPLSDRLKADDGLMELGLGIHGEPGRETVPIKSADDLVASLLHMLVDQFPPANLKRVVLLVNNLGGTTALELYGIVHAALNCLARDFEAISVARVYAGPFMTSLEMQGVSISLLNLSSPGEASGADMIQLLDAPACTLGWVGELSSFRGEMVLNEIPVIDKPATSADVQASSSSELLSESQAVTFGQRLRAAAQAIIKAEPQLTDLDLQCGDGDAGETFKRGAADVLKRLDSEQFDLKSPAAVMGSLSECACAMGGTSGAVLAIFFRACENSLRNAQPLGTALESGTRAITKYGGAKPGSRTMLDPLDAVSKVWTDQSTSLQLAQVASEAAQSTSFMKSSAGRSNYISDEKLHGVPDPGAIAVAVALEGFASVDQA